jgi:hypothetical protein
MTTAERLWFAGSILVVVIIPGFSLWLPAHIPALLILIPIQLIGLAGAVVAVARAARRGRAA